MATIGQRLATIRTMLGLTQADFAVSLLVSRSYLSEVENDKGKPSIEMIFGIAAYYDWVNLEWLLTGKGDPGDPEASQKGISRAIQRVNEVPKEVLSALESDKLSMKPIDDLSYPLSNEQELLLTSYTMIPPVPIADRLSREEHRRVLKGDVSIILEYAPIALAKPWLLKAIGTTPENRTSGDIVPDIVSFKVEDDSFLPDVPTGSIMLIDMRSRSISDTGFYLGTDLENNFQIFFFDANNPELCAAKFKDGRPVYTSIQLVSKTGLEEWGRAVYCLRPL